MTAKNQYSTRQDHLPTDCLTAHLQNVQPFDPPTVEIIIDPLPLPPDFLNRLAKIYALALQRYNEHHQIPTGESEVAA